MSLLLDYRRTKADPETGKKLVELFCCTCAKAYWAQAATSQRRKNCDDCKKPTLGATDSGFCYITADLQPYIDDIVDRLDARLRKENGIQEDDTTAGAIEQIVREVSRAMKMTHEAAARRFYAVRCGERKVTDTEFADAIFLADGRFIDHEEGLKVYPSTKAGALEMATIEAENFGVTLSPASLRERADQLYNEAIEAVFGVADIAA